jgi:hypothetical protein
MRFELTPLSASFGRRLQRGADGFPRVKAFRPLDTSLASAILA